MTIVEAVKEVLQQATTGMTSKDIYELILKRNLYVFPAKNPVGVVNSTIRRHCAGLDFPTASPIKHFSVEKCFGKKTYYTLLKEPLQEDTVEIDNVKIKNSGSDALPEERLQTAYDEHLNSIKEQLLNAILKNPPSFFEHLIVDLLIKMGYGDPSSARVTGGSHDGGIDGIISEDKLGLDLIYLQAKRNKAENTVGRKELQAFVGAMQNVHKGVFITTSAFTKEASEYAATQQQKNLKLIDGSMLASLMMRYEVGLVIKKVMMVFQIDNSYFE